VEETSPRLPSGSESIARFAAMRGLHYAAHPDDAWFRKWEPYDTIAPPSRYFNAITWSIRPEASRRHSPESTVVVAEPWTALDDAEPLERTLLGFAIHPGLMRRAAMRVGEHFLTRTLFLESLPPPTVKVGDKVWDTHVTTFAASSLEAATAFHPSLRKLLASWGFRGHLELRAGGLVLHYAGIPPLPDQYERLMRIVAEVLNHAIAYPRS
jgi:hypothetical protein